MRVVWPMKLLAKHIICGITEANAASACVLDVMSWRRILLNAAETDAAGGVLACRHNAIDGNCNLVLKASTWAEERPAKPPSARDRLV